MQKLAARLLIVAQTRSTRPEGIRMNRILLIQSEQVERERLAQLIGQESYTIVQANNGAEGLALFRQTFFDLVITDNEMPFVEGPELAVHIKHLDPSQPILMLAGRWQKPSEENPVDI